MRRSGAPRKHAKEQAILEPVRHSAPPGNRNRSAMLRVVRSESATWGNPPASAKRPITGNSPGPEHGGSREPHALAVRFEVTADADALRVVAPEARMPSVDALELIHDASRCQRTR